MLLAILQISSLLYYKLHSKLVKQLYRFLAVALIVFKRSLKLVLHPYKEMRTIADKSTYGEACFIFLWCSLLLFISSYVKGFYGLQHVSSPLVPVVIFLLQSLGISLFFYTALRLLGRKEVSLRRIVVVLSYSLAPTYVWFLSTSILFFLLPPPRSFSLLGTSFSFVFLVWSLMLLYWKCILLYLSVRFASKLSFGTVIYLCILFLTWLVPYSLLLYRLGLFRIPFV